MWTSLRPCRPAGGRRRRRLRVLHRRFPRHERVSVDAAGGVARLRGAVRAPVEAAFQEGRTPTLVFA